MKTLLTNIGIGFLIGFLTVMAANIAFGASTNQPEPTWCEQWNTLGDEAGAPAVTTSERFMFHLGHFLTKSDPLRKLIQHNNPTFDEQTMDKVMTCYEENTPALVELLDNICKVPSASQDKEVSSTINRYINWCIEKSTTKA